MKGDASRAAYRDNPDMWLASSHPELARRKPQELFEAEFAKRYRRLHKDLWLRVVRVHSTLLTLEQLQDFPFNHICTPDDVEFWKLVIGNFLDAAGLGLHSLVGDNSGSDVHSILSFKNEIALGPWLDPNDKELFFQTCRKRKFDGVVQSIAKRVGDIRNNWIAHRLIDKATACYKAKLGTVNLAELRVLFEAGHSLFGALSFGKSYSTLTLDLMPGTVGGKLTHTALDSVLNAVLRDCYFVNRPEREPQWWPTHRQQMPPDELRLMNDLRERVELPPA